MIVTSGSSGGRRAAEGVVKLRRSLAVEIWNFWFFWHFYLYHIPSFSHIGSLVYAQHYDKHLMMTSLNSSNKSDR